MNLDETRLRFGDIATKFQEVLALNNINAKILGADISDEDKKTILAGEAFCRFLERAGK